MGLFDLFSRGPVTVEKIAAWKEKQNIKGLVKALREEEFELWWVAAQALGELKAESATGLLIKAMKEPEHHVGYNAAVAMGKIGGEKTIETLARATRSGDARLCSHAVTAIGEIETPQAEAMLLEILQNNKTAIRCAAASALGYRKSLAAVEPLIELYNSDDTHTDLRSEAIRALGTIGDARARPHIIAATKDKEFSVRLQAVYVLKKSKDASVEQVLTDVLDEENLQSVALSALIENGVETEVIAPDGNPLLVWAALHQKCNVIDLAASGADVNAVDKDGKSALMHLIDDGTVDQISALIKHGANVDHQDNSGKTPLMQTAFYGQLETATMLLKYGADASLKDKNNHSAADWADQWGRPGIAALISKHTSP